MENKMVLFAIYVTLSILFFGLTSSYPAENKRQLPGTCTFLSVLSGEAYKCLSILGALNDTINSQQEICLMYDEAVRCIQTETVNNGVSCTTDQIHIILKQYAASGSSGFLTPLNIQNCNVSTSLINNDICDDMDRLGLYISLTCARSMFGTAGVHFSSSLTCILLSSLKSCATTFLGYIGATCTPRDIDLALVANSTTDWLKAHYPDVNLGQCFKTFNPNQNLPSDPRCSQESFVTGSGPQCLALGALNATLVEQNTFCKAYVLTLRCLQHTALDNGFHCKMETLESTLTRMHFDYAFHVDSTCRAALPQLGTSFDICHDATALLQLSALNPYCAPYLSDIYKDTQCSHIDNEFISCATSKLLYAGYSCTKDNFWTALMSATNQAWMTTNFPHINATQSSH